MATRADRVVRRSLPMFLALLLTLFASAGVSQAGVDHPARSAAASSAARAGQAPSPSPVSATFEPAIASVDAALCDVVADRERVLPTQPVLTVRAARAPPLHHL